jgi:hypothetical protein
VRPPIGKDLVPDRAEDLELVGAADQRRERRPFLFRTRAQDAPDREGGELALDVHLIERLVLERLRRGPVRALADHDAADRRLVLEPRRGVHHVAGRDPLPLLDLGVDVDDDLPGVDRDPDGELQRWVLSFSSSIAADDLPGRLHRSDGVVLARGRGAEQADDGVAMNFSTVPSSLTISSRAGGSRAETSLHVLGIGAVGARREPGQVGEQHRIRPFALRLHRQVVPPRVVRGGEPHAHRTERTAG